MVAGTAAIVWGAERFAEHLADASKRLGVTAFGRSIQRYAFGGLVAGILATAFMWDGALRRVEGAILVGAYVVFVATIWLSERRPPSLGEAGELDEAADPEGRVGSDLAWVLAGLVALTLGSMVLVEGVRQLTDIESTQTRLGLTVVGFATAFELVVLAFSASRHGVTEAVIAGVIGSYAYNMTMSLGVGALVAPISITDASLLHAPLVVMLALLAVVIALGVRRGSLGRRDAVALFVGYPVFVLVALW